MAFNSLVFLLFFAAVLLLHSLPLDWRAKKMNLLLASFVFYAAWNPPFIVLLWLSTLTDWYAARRIASSSGASKHVFLVVSVMVNLGLLGYFKYGQFLLENFAALLAVLGVEYPVTGGNIILPLGISFYTFQSMSYTIDVYRGKLRPGDSLLDFALYVSFFPQLVAGPILRAGYFLEQLGVRYEERVRELGWGFALITLGMFEKIVLADGVLAPIVERVYGSAAAAATADAWTGTLAFSGQIFFDFNGYSVIAVGLAKCLGFQLPWNFLSPYAAIGFSDFWRRWHVTLSSWLRDYLYISLSGNRAGALRTLVNLMTTMLLGGLWHGASWLFVIWGGVHGLLLVAERLLKRLARDRALLQGGVPRAVLGLLTFAMVTLSWVLFRADGTPAALHLLSVMLLPDGAAMLVSRSDIAVVALLIAALLCAHWFLRGRSFEAMARRLSWPTMALLLGLMLAAIILSPGEERDFIYFEF